MPTFPPSLTLEQLNLVFFSNRLSVDLGIRLTALRADALEGEMSVDERHLRPGGIMNGGISLLLIETFGSIATAATLDFPRQNALGIQVSANHLAIARPGDQLRIVAQPVHVGRTTQIWEVSIRNETDRLVCSGRITMLVTDSPLEKRPAKEPAKG